MNTRLYFRIVGGLLLGFTVLLLGFLSFSRYMSVGRLQSWPLGGTVLVAFSDNGDVSIVMRELCQEYASVPSVNRKLFHKLLTDGVIVHVQDSTPISLHEQGYSSNNELRLSSFEIRRGQWKGKVGWSCPGSVKLAHAYP